MKRDNITAVSATEPLKYSKTFINSFNVYVDAYRKHLSLTLLSLAIINKSQEIYNEKTAFRFLHEKNSVVINHN